MRNKERNFSIFFFVSSLFLIIFLIFSNFKLKIKEQEINLEVKDLKSEIEKLTKKKEELKKILAQIENKIYWEQLAREEGFVREGEDKIVIKKIESEKEKNEKENIWIKIFKLFNK